MEKMIAFCGLDCSGCEAYVATQANDQAAKEALLVKWRKEYSPDMDISAVTCDGCMTLDGRIGGYCAECPVRACSMERGFPNCAHCGDYEGCETLAGFLAMAPQLKESLDAIRSTL